MPTSYSQLAHLYDDVLGDRDDEVERVSEVIGVHTPNASHICEFGCGTGAILAPFAEQYNVYGVDSSPDMLTQARANVPTGRFFEGDMRTFTLPDTMDVIISMYDSINHLLTLDDWRATFENARQNLVQGGLFFFDMNIKERLDQLNAQSPFYHEGERYTAEFTVTHIGDRLYRFTIKAAFEDGTRAHEEIDEYTPEVESVRNELQRIFSTVTITDSQGNIHNLTKAPRLFVIAQ